MTTAEVRTLVEAEYIPIALLGRAASTVTAHRREVERFADWCDTAGRLPFVDATVAAYLSHLLAGGARPATANKARALVLAWWRFAHGRRYLDSLPRVPSCPSRRTIPRAWTVEELGRIFAAAGETPGLVGSIPAGQWWSTLHLWLWETGERLAASLANRWDWSALADDRLTFSIPADARKGGKPAVYRLSANVSASLLGIAPQPRTGPVWPFPWCRAIFYRHYGDLLERAGVDRSGRAGPHQMRRAMASHLAASQGAAAARAALGHANDASTARYLDPRICGGVSFADHLPAIKAPTRMVSQF